MQVSLELSGHPKANVRGVILSDSTVVGRSRDCGLQIASASVSRKHCEIRLNGEDVTVVDLGSSNGTFVDSERLPAGEARPLRPGSRLNVGGVRFIVSYEPARAESAAPPPVAAAPATVEVEAASEDAIAAEEPILPQEPVLPEEPALADEPILPSESFVTDEPVSTVAAKSADLDEPDLADLFAETPETERPSSGGKQPATSEATIEEDEPILGGDEDEAFAFLTDDEPAAPPKKR